MRPPTPVTESRIAELEEFRKSKWPGEELQRFLCVWLRVKQGMTTKEIAITVGWHVNLGCIDINARHRILAPCG